MTCTCCCPSPLSTEEIRDFPCRIELQDVHPREALRWIRQQQRSFSNPPVRITETVVWDITELGDLKEVKTLRVEGWDCVMLTMMKLVF